ncbi:MAG: alkaline phosphatase PhoX [Planctomycetota bacterium]
MLTLDRRSFLQSTAAAVSAAFLGLRTYDARAQEFAGELMDPTLGYGPLIPDPEGVFDLPAGFRYRVISQAGQRMDDGLFVPGMADGMAAFDGPNGTVVLVRNHENRNTPAGKGPFGWSRELATDIPSEKMFDAGEDGANRPALGGTTNVVYDPKSQRVVREFMSLAGTERNCAGGPTPWNTWITCEETVGKAGQDGRGCDHGYNFEVPATADPTLFDPIPLRDMGRFNHEAVAVEPETGIVYQTEDRQDGIFTRFIPNEKGNLAAGGKLQALAIVGKPSFDTRNWIDNDAEAQTGGAFQEANDDETAGKATINITQGTVLDVAWIDLENVDDPEDTLRYRGFDAGAARFARGEGMWYGRDAVFFACTTGGMNRKGQLWRYVPSRFEGQPEERRFPGRLELFLEPNNHELVENADNLCVAPWGDLIVCEDAGRKNHLVGVTPDGQLYHFGLNAFSNSELAGSCFSPDGQTLFVNIQGDGLTLAVTGPWDKRSA